MKKIQYKNTQISWVYWGTFITSLGTFTFPGATIGIMTSIGRSAFEIGLLMALCRLGTLCGTILLGDISDRVDPKKIVIWSEVFALICTFGLISSWSLGKDYFYVFASIVFVRFFIISIGGPSRNKILKILAEKYKKDHFKSGVVLNLETYAPTFIGSILAFFTLKYFNYYYVLLFDSLTFIINGYIIYKFIDTSQSNVNTNSYSEKNSFIQKIRIYFKNKKLAWYDILLAIPFMGTNVLMSRLAKGAGEIVPLFLATFGIAVLLSTYILSFRASRKYEVVYYLGLAFSFAIILLVQHSVTSLIFAIFLRNLFYWLIFNIYTGRFQEESPKDQISSILSIRIFFNTLLLGMGELIIGTYSLYFSLNFDLYIRMSICIFLFLLGLKWKNECREVI